MADGDPTISDPTISDPTGGDPTGGDLPGGKLPGRVVRRPLVDPVALVFGLLALVTAGSGVVGRLPVPPGFDSRWLLALGAALLGILLLAGTFRRR